MILIPFLFYFAFAQQQSSQEKALRFIYRLNSLKLYVNDRHDLKFPLTFESTILSSLSSWIPDYYKITETDLQTMMIATVLHHSTNDPNSKQAAVEMIESLKSSPLETCFKQKTTIKVFRLCLSNGFSFASTTCKHTNPVKILSRLSNDLNSLETADVEKCDISSDRQAYREAMALLTTLTNALPHHTLFKRGFILDIPTSLYLLVMFLFFFYATFFAHHKLLYYPHLLWMVMILLIVYNKEFNGWLDTTFDPK